MVLVDYVTIFLQMEEPQFKPARVKWLYTFKSCTQSQGSHFDAAPTSFIVVPHVVTGNWKMAKAAVKSTGVQEGSLVSSRLIESTSMCGQVASRATTTTNWPSLVHCTVTGGQTGQVHAHRVPEAPRSPQKPTAPTCSPVVALRSIKAAAYVSALLSGDVSRTAPDLLSFVHLALVKGVRRRRGARWLQRMLQLRFLQPLAPGSDLTGQNKDHRNSKQTVEQLHYHISNHTLAKPVTRAPRPQPGAFILH